MKDLRLFYKFWMRSLERLEKRFYKIFLGKYY